MHSPSPDWLAQLARGPCEQVIRYLLVQVTAGAAARVAAQIERYQEAESVAVVSGAFDVIARMRPSDASDPNDRVVRLIRSTDGVLRVLACRVGYLRSSDEGDDPRVGS
jgi:hypothetical protein